MSGIVGHMMYALLGAKAAHQRKLPIGPLVHRHLASYLAGSYLGCDVQTLPAATCLDTGEPVGYCAQVLTESPLTGGPVTPWTLDFRDASYTPRAIYLQFYGRAHLVFGWRAEERDHTLPWDHLADYAAWAAGDALELFGPGQRPLAYLLGWLAHVVSDSLIKSVQPGITLDLLNGKYTPQNRPIQDLVTYHEIGRQEFGLNWPALMSDLVDTPVEPVQAHYMRLADPRGQLAKWFPCYWKPELEPLLLKVQQENRRFQRVRNERLWRQMELVQTNSGWKCDEELSRRTGGLAYHEMVKLAADAGFRHALWQMGEAICDLFEQIVQRQPRLQTLPADDGPSWDEITARWRKKTGWRATLLGKSRTTSH